MVFNASFYREVLPERVKDECHGHPEAIPVVNLHLANGRTLDLCHVVHLADTWLAVQHFRDTETCDDMDLVFLPYELVTMVAVSLHHATSRRMGFSVGEQPHSLKGRGVETGLANVKPTAVSQPVVQEGQSR